METNRTVLIIGVCPRCTFLTRLQHSIYAVVEDNYIQPKITFSLNYSIKIDMVHVIPAEYLVKCVQDQEMM